jgi:methyltransferase (TIGR00027 family)
MEPAPPILRDISDTARWVAMYRALETDRPDAHFHDPFARLLAGERGEEILRRMPGARRTAWPMVVRTCVFDELILKCVERDGADAVLNLASGLDTRPYRLPLPASLRWFEADLPEILSYKESRLASERPRCLLESVKIDLADASARRALFARVASASRKAVVVSEGFLIYLTEDQVTALARDLHGHPSLRWWVIDLAAPLLLKRLRRRWKDAMNAANARMQFAPEKGTEFFRGAGWREAEFRSTLEDARRLRREMPFAWIFHLAARLASKRRREIFRRMAATVLLERLETPGG